MASTKGTHVQGEGDARGTSKLLQQGADELLLHCLAQAGHFDLGKGGNRFDIHPWKDFSNIFTLMVVIYN